jgi:hypothetical protein
MMWLTWAATNMIRITTVSASTEMVRHGLIALRTTPGHCLRAYFFRLVMVKMW